MASGTGGFASFVPGFDFLQNLVKNAGSALPSMGQWVVPTLDPEELERRIGELRTVQFWLEQNSRMLATTIQALEVQRMTLSALKGMNVSVNELQDALKVRPAAPSPMASAPPFATPAPAPAAAPAASADSSGASAGAAPGAAPAGVVDAMQWWGSLTQQFTQLAAQAMQAAAPAAAAKPGAAQAPGPGSPTPPPARPRRSAAKTAAPRSAKPAGKS